jgi:hypothetical protein
MIYYDKLKDFLESKLGLAYYNGAKDELVTYCPYCEPKSKKPHGHCYIKVVSTIEMPTFYCQKCNEDGGKGTLTKLIKFLKGNPKQFISEDTLGTILTKTRDYQRKDFEYYEYKTVEADPDRYKLKRYYLHSRLGFEYDLDRINGLVLNIREFLYENKIELNDTVKKYLDFFETSFVGFITTRGTKLILRNIDPNSDFRYFKIDLVKNTFFNDFYGFRCGQIKNEINKVILCEGIFDLIVGLNSFELNDIKNTSCFAAAIIGNHYGKIISSVLDYCKLTYSDLVILSDIDNNLYKNLKLNPMVNNLEVYWNKLGKDFGAKPIEITRMIF